MKLHLQLAVILLVAFFLGQPLFLRAGTGQLFLLAQGSLDDVLHSRQGKVTPGSSYKDVNKIFLQVAPSIDPFSSSAIDELASQMSEHGIDVKAYGEPKLNGQAIDKIIIGTAVYDALHYFTKNKKWNPFLVPIDVELGKNSVQTGSQTVPGSSTNGGDANRAFREISASIDPASSNALYTLVDGLKERGFAAKVYGEPKLGGKPVDKVIIDNVTYDALVYFSGPKRWNPCLVPLNK